MKSKNMIQKAHRKLAEAHKINSGRLIPPLTEAEGLAISQNSPQLLSEGPFADSSSEQGTNRDIVTDSVVYVIEPPATAKEPTANRAGVPSTSTTQLDAFPVSELYRHHLMKTIEKADKEMTYLDRQIRKADLEILLLEHQSREVLHLLQRYGKLGSQESLVVSLIFQWI